MSRTAAAICIASSVAVLGIGRASAESDSPSPNAARCKPGTVAAVIASKRVCLRRGQRCEKRLDKQYHRYGFHCHAGRLTRPTGPKAKPLPPAGTLVAEVPAPSWGGIAAGGGAMWVANLGPHTVTRIDPDTNAIAATIRIGDGAPDPFHGPTFVAFGHGTLWVLDGSANCSCVHRIDPQTNDIVSTISLGSPTLGRIAPLSAVVRPEAVWVAARLGTEDAPNGSVIRIDPATNRVVAIVGAGTNPEFGGPTGIASDANGVWVGVPSTKSVIRIDPATNSVVATIPDLKCGEGQLAADDSGVWVADCDAVRRIDPRTNTIAKAIPIPGATAEGARGIALGLGSVWTQAGPLVRIDTASGAVTGASPLDPALVWGEYSVAIGFGSVWVRQQERVVRFQP